MNTMNYRYIARVLIGNTTPLSLSSGEKSLVTDKLVVRDINGLPFIPGTSLAGVLRSAFVTELSKQYEKASTEWDKIFGYQKDKANNGQGSRLIVSSAHFTGKGGKVFEGVEAPDWKDEFYAQYKKLPVRDHVRMNHTGTAEDKGKFDEEVVIKGSRFTFELELVGNAEDKEKWGKILTVLSDPAFRLGSGSRKGFGEIKVIKISQQYFDLADDKQRGYYLEKSSSLAKPFSGLKFESENLSTKVTCYQLQIKPVDFFLFSSGAGSEDADMIPAFENYIQWDGNNNPAVVYNAVLLPSSSVKGAIAHRVAYHYNKQNGVTAELISDPGSVGTLIAKGYHINAMERFNSLEYKDRIKLATIYNPAVVALFGYSVSTGDKTVLDEKCKARGKVIFSDILEKRDHFTFKQLNHVSIDRFTGGAIDGALFNEQVVTSDKEFEMNLYVEKEVLENETVKEAFEKSLSDIANGLLPLGGGTMRGHGCFEGRILKNGEQL